jgi:hypothetical protein
MVFVLSLLAFVRLKSSYHRPATREWRSLTFSVPVALVVLEHCAGRDFLCALPISPFALRGLQDVLVLPLLLGPDSAQMTTFRHR